MGGTACTEPQCLYKGALYLFLKGVKEGLVPPQLTAACTYIEYLYFLLQISKFIKIYMHNMAFLTALLKNAAVFFDYLKMEPLSSPETPITNQQSTHGRVPVD
jgi:hypothetical protein